MTCTYTCTCTCTCISYLHGTVHELVQDNLHVHVHVDFWRSFIPMTVNLQSKPPCNVRGPTNH